MSKYETIRYEVEDRVLTITLDRPDVLNAFTPTMAEELVAAFDRAGSDHDVAAIVVTGAGRAFCAGMDLSVEGNVFGLDESLRPSMQDMIERLDDPEIRTGVRDTGGRVALAIFDCPKPVIAAINGAAVGIGATMTLAMDVRLASDTAKIGFVFGKLGIVCEACSSWFLPRIVGVQQALDWLYSADVFDAEAARTGGLVKEVVPADELLARASALAHQYIDGKSAVATALMRQMVYRNSALPHPLEAHRIDSLAMFYTSIGDGSEGVRAFRERRSPQFTGRVPEDLPNLRDAHDR